MQIKLSNLETLLQVKGSRASVSDWIRETVLNNNIFLHIVSPFHFQESSDRLSNGEWIDVLRLGDIETMISMGGPKEPVLTIRFYGYPCLFSVRV